MPRAIPVIDLDAAEAGDNAQLTAVRAATEDLGAVQVVNHGVPHDLIADLGSRMARLLALPRAEKAMLASPHPYRGWRQWPDDFGRLELERFNVAQFDDIGHARAAGLADEYLGLYAQANVWPADDPGLREVALAYIEAARRLAGRMLRLYATAQGLPGDTFGLGELPHLRLTVNDYPTWTYPEATGRGALQAEQGMVTSCCCSSTRTTRRSRSWRRRETTKGCRSSRPAGTGLASRSSRARCRSSPGRCSPGGPAAGCARAGTGSSRAAR